MKTLKQILIIALVFWISACNKPENEGAIIFNTNFLEQTAWQGVYSWSETVVSYSVSVLFIDNNHGLLETSMQDKTFNFTYEIINNKILKFNVGSVPIINGEWIVATINQNSMTLRRDFFNENDGKFLIFQKTVSLH